MKLLNNIFRMNWFLFVLMVGLTLVGLFFIKSATDSSELTGVHPLVRQQESWAIVGVFVFLFFSLVNYEVFLRLALPLYMLSLLALIAVLLFGETVNGATSWIRIGRLILQPAEPCKIGFILGMTWLALVLGDYKEKFWFFIFSGVVAMIPAYLIFRQPDLGTALVFFPMTFIIMWAAGIPKRYLALLITGVACGFLFAYYMVYQASWDGTIGDLLPAGKRAAAIAVHKSEATPAPAPKLVVTNAGVVKAPTAAPAGEEVGKRKSGIILKPYQLDRIKTFFNPDLDPLGAGWTIRQSLNTIGSGGFRGKGYVSEYGFLPRNIAYNDFIFAVIGEEVGFVGGALFIILQGCLIIGVMYVASRSKDVGGMLICLGFDALLFAHFFQNVGMTIKVVPITGIPLPFTSYGGSFLVTCMAGMGLVQSVWIQRKNFVK